MSKPSIDLPLARMCANACARAYQSMTLGSELAHVLVEYSEGPMILAFRGSASTRDWLTDFRIGFTDTGLGHVHSGFWESTQSVMRQVLILDQRSVIAPVILTGHSKGAAEALLCAWLLARAGRPVQAVVTFGGPRVGDAGWRQSYNGMSANNGSSTLGEITQRWVHEEDIVCRLAAWCTGYRHVATEAFLCSFGGVEINPPLWHKAASDLWGTFWGYEHGHIEQAADHPVSTYQEHINHL